MGRDYVMLFLDFDVHQMNPQFGESTGNTLIDVAASQANPRQIWEIYHARLWPYKFVRELNLCGSDHLINHFGKKI